MKTNVEKRAVERIPIQIDFHCFQMDCFGTIANLSETGMFISSNKITFPFKYQFNIYIPLKGDMLNIRVQVNRLNKAHGYYDGLGVELINPPLAYLEFVSYLKSSKN